MEKQSNPKGEPFFIAEGDSVCLDVRLKDRFKILLRRKGISQNQLADLIGINKGTMSKIVNGDWTPTSQLMIKIAQNLDCDSAVIFGDQKYWLEWRDKIGYPKEEKGEVHNGI